MTRVVVVCPGLDHAHRGFESFARECFEELGGDPRLELSLVKGTGARAPRERPVPTLRRETAPARALARATRLDPYVVEHLSFSLALFPLLLRRRPDVVYFSEWHVGRALAAWRRASRQRFAIAICNGSSSPGPYDHLDLVQHLTPGALEWVLERGADPARNVALPLGVRIPAALDLPSADERAALRERLGLPRDRRIVVSVAALNRQKRHHHLIAEVAALPQPRPFLLMVGQEESETPPLRALARERLGADGHAMRTVPRGEVEPLVRASDVFVLASLWEGLPRALIEAMALGLPCLAHAYPVMEYALGGMGRTLDMEAPGALARALAEIGEADLAPEAAHARHRSVHERFSWDALRERYVQLLLRAAAGRRC